MENEFDMISSSFFHDAQHTEEIYKPSISVILDYLSVKKARGRSPD